MLKMLFQLVRQKLQIQQNNASDAVTTKTTGIADKANEVEADISSSVEASSDTVKEVANKPEFYTES